MTGSGSLLKVGVGTFGEHRLVKHILLFSWSEALYTNGVKPFYLGSRADKDYDSRLANEHRLLVEPACGAVSLAMIKRKGVEVFQGCYKHWLRCCGQNPADIMTLLQNYGL